MKPTHIPRMRVTRSPNVDSRKVLPLKLRIKPITVTEDSESPRSSSSSVPSFIKNVWTPAGTPDCTTPCTPPSTRQSSPVYSVWSIASTSTENENCYLKESREYFQQEKIQEPQQKGKKYKYVRKDKKNKKRIRELQDKLTTALQDGLVWKTNCEKKQEEIDELNKELEKLRSEAVDQSEIIEKLQAEVVDQSQLIEFSTKRIAALEDKGRRSANVQEQQRIHRRMRWRTVMKNERLNEVRRIQEKVDAAVAVENEKFKKWQEEYVDSVQSSHELQDKVDDLTNELAQVRKSAEAARQMYRADIIKLYTDNMNMRSYINGKQMATVDNSNQLLNTEN